jgi:hypothetical protein
MMSDIAARATAADATVFSAVDGESRTVLQVFLGNPAILPEFLSVFRDGALETSNPALAFQGTDAAGQSMYHTLMGNADTDAVIAILTVLQQSAGWLSYADPTARNGKDWSVFVEAIRASATVQDANRRLQAMLHSPDGVDRWPLVEDSFLLTSIMSLPCTTAEDYVGIVAMLTALFHRGLRLGFPGINAVAGFLDAFSLAAWMDHPNWTKNVAVNACGEGPLASCARPVCECIRSNTAESALQLLRDARVDFHDEAFGTVCTDGFDPPMLYALRRAPGWSSAAEIENDAMNVAATRWDLDDIKAVCRALAVRGASMGDKVRKLSLFPGPPVFTTVIAKFVMFMEHSGETEELLQHLLDMDQTLVATLAKRPGAVSELSGLVTAFPAYGKQLGPLIQQASKPEAGGWSQLRDGWTTAVAAAATAAAARKPDREKGDADDGKRQRRRVE